MNLYWQNEFKRVFISALWKCALTSTFKKITKCNTMPISNLHKSVLEQLQYINVELFINVTASMTEVSICSYKNRTSQLRFCSRVQVYWGQDAYYFFTPIRDAIKRLAVLEHVLQGIWKLQRLRLTFLNFPFKKLESNC